MRSIRFWTTLLLGAAIGGAVVANMDERKLDQLKTRTRGAVSGGRTGQLADTLTSGVADIADVATARVDAAIDHTTTAVADSLAADATEAESTASSVPTTVNRAKA